MTEQSAEAAPKGVYIIDNVVTISGTKSGELRRL